MYTIGQVLGAECRVANKEGLDQMRKGYGVAMISRLLKIIDLICKRALRKR